MVMDKNGKLGGKISIIDVMAIVLVVLVAAGIGVRYKSRITGSVKSHETFEYVIRVSSIRDYTVNALKKGGNLTDKRSEKVLGEIVDVKVEAAEENVTTSDGRIVAAKVPDRYTCEVTIRADGKESDEGYILDDSTELSVGRYVDLFTQYCKTSGEIKSVEVVKK